MRLFDEDARFTHEGMIVSDTLTKALEPIMRLFVERGINPRELAHMANIIVNELECEAILGFLEDSLDG